MTCPDNELWKEAIDIEQASLDDHKIFEDAYDLPDEMKAIGCRWIFKVKMKPDPKRTGQLIVDKYKARLVLKGYKQRHGVDFKETFAPVVRTDILRLILALSLEDPEIELEQMDVRTAFLESALEETIFMQAPEGHPTEAPYVKLLRTLYGLKQAPREFHKTMEKYLLCSAGFTKVASANCVYIKRREDRLCIICLYVDDLILAGHRELLNDTKAGLNDRFSMKDLGELKYALGIRIKRNRAENTIGMSQEHYIEEVLKENGFNQCRPAPTPASDRLSKTMCPRTDQERASVRSEFHRLNYRKAIGQLLCICNTQPDIAFAVGQAARFVQDPGRAHYLAVKRILKYLRGT